ncbi:MAG: serine O-acetyltransferase [Opitutales bacterium]|nr:serine O-acetyltransferase [Opitutales bacterium]
MKNCCSNDIEEEIDLWQEMHCRAEQMLQAEPLIAHLFVDFILSKNSFADALATRLAHKLSSSRKEFDTFFALSKEAFTATPYILIQAQNDMQATADRDPACDSVLAPFLWFKGFLALSAYRVSHHFWNAGRRHIAHYLQSHISETFSVDIHPASNIGCGILLDHATGFVVGETAVVENNVSILHAVTLGGTGKTRGDRHPKVRSGVLIGAGAKILGNIEVGTCAKVGAGSVVLDNVPAHTTVAGVPAKIVGMATEAEPSLGMNHQLFS